MMSSEMTCSPQAGPGLMRVSKREREEQMRKCRFTEEQIVGLPREHEAGLIVAELSRGHGVREQTIYRWTQKYAGLEISEL
jgi:putative transposase